MNPQDEAKNLMALVQNMTVEWKSLSDVAEYSTTRIKAEDLDENNYVGVDNLLQNRGGKKSSNFVPNEGNMIQFSPNDILLGNIRPYLKKIWLAECVGGASGDVLVIHITDKTILPHYLYHILASDAFFTYSMKHKKGTKMPRGNKIAIMKYNLPVPSINIQQKIAEILDRFVKLENKLEKSLETELNLRKQQYNYYRDYLLTFDESGKQSLTDRQTDRQTD